MGELGCRRTEKNSCWTGNMYTDPLVRCFKYNMSRFVPWPIPMEFREWADPFRRPSAGAKRKQPHVPKIRDSECMSNTQMNSMIRGIDGLSSLLCSRLSQDSCECHSRGMYRDPVSLRLSMTFTAVLVLGQNTSELSVILRVCFRLGHVHIDRPSAMAIVLLKTARTQETVIHTKNYLIKKRLKDGRRCEACGMAAPRSYVEVDVESLSKALIETGGSQSAKYRGALGNRFGYGSRSNGCLCSYQHLGSCSAQKSQR